MLYLGKFSNVWGHCLTDNLKHLWFLLNEDAVERVSGYRMVYSVVSKNPLPESFFSLLEAIGIDLGEIEEVRAPTKFKEVLVPDECFMLDPEKKQRVCTIDYLNLLRKCYENGKEHHSFPEKIYLSRTNFASSRDYGEENVQRVFEKIGYTVVYPEQIELSKMISMMQGCSSLACTEGSISHNAVFLKDGAEIVILRKARCLNGYQAIINSIKKLDVKYIDANMSIFPWDSKNRWKGPFYLCVNRRLVRYSGGLPRISLKCFLRYTSETLPGLIKWRIRNRITRVKKDGVSSLGRLK